MRTESAMQPTLFAHVPRKAKPEIKISTEDADTVLTALRFERTWIKREDLASRLKMDLRIIRAIAEMSGEIIYSQDGLKHIINASESEMLGCVNDLNSRKDAYAKRISRIFEKWNKQTKGGESNG